LSHPVHYLRRPARAGGPQGSAAPAAGADAAADVGVTAACADAEL
jgi:hypothetical protein